MANTSNIKYTNTDLSSFSGEIDRRQIKRITKNLIESHKKGHVDDATFTEIIEHLLAFFIERSLEDKISSKMYRLDTKLNKLHRSWKW